MGKRENYFLSYEKGYVMPYILSEKKKLFIPEPSITFEKWKEVW